MLGIAAAVCAAMTLLAGAALAGNPNNPGTGGPPAGQGTPPGQAKKGTTGQGNAANGKALGKGKEKAGKASQPAHPTHPSHPSHPSHPVTPSHPDGTATKVIVPQKPAFAATKGKGHENTAHHKVIICHRTGSATNPYVAINVSINAWQNGHTKHPALDGRSDILLKDPASPGEKPDPALVASMCGGQPAQSAQQAAAQAATANAAKSSPRIVAAAGVKGAAASKPSASQPKGSAGVLGAISTPVRRGELPFTGLPLWTAALAAGTLGALGLALRRRAQAS
jgi:hypothetical protein